MRLYKRLVCLSVRKPLTVSGTSADYTRYILSHGDIIAKVAQKYKTRTNYRTCVHAVILQSFAYLQQIRLKRDRLADVMRLTSLRRYCDPKLQLVGSEQYEHRTGTACCTHQLQASTLVVKLDANPLTSNLYISDTGTQ